METCYKMVHEHFYGKRSSKDVPYMKHIDEGLLILQHLKVEEYVMAAYAVHPLFQTPDMLLKIWGNKEYLAIDKHILILAMEYRNKANAFVCRERTDHYEMKDMPIIVMPEVKNMLIADKVQNHANFRRHYSEDHPRREKIKKYFEMWEEHLGISYNQFNSIVPIY